MENIINFIDKVSTIWKAVGGILVGLGLADSISGLDFSALFDQAFIDALKTAVGGVAIFIGYIKSQVIKKVIEEGEVAAKSFTNMKKVAFAINPFVNKI